VEGVGGLGHLLASGAVNKNDPNDAVAEDQQVSCFLLLEPGHLGDGVAPEEGGVVPVGAV